MAVEIEKLTRRRRMVLAASGLLFIILQPAVYATLDAPMAVWRAVACVGRTASTISAPKY